MMGLLNKLIDIGKTLIFFVLMSVNVQARADLFPDFELPDFELPDFELPDFELNDLGIIKNFKDGPDWFPKPYRIPIEQGSLNSAENFARLEPGLSREQVKFLLGTPTITDPFHSDRWDYVYFDRMKVGIDQPKRVTIIFKNERVAEIYDQYNLVKKMGSLSDIAFKDAPIIEKTPEDAALGYQEIVLARREDFLISKKESRLPICIGNDADFETFVAERTLVNAEEDSLEIRSDQQSQDETGVFYASGSVEIERSEDLIKSDQAEFNSETGVLSAYNNVKYLRENLSINAKEGGYNSQTGTVAFSGAKYNLPTLDHPAAGKADDIFIDEAGAVHLTPSTYTTCSLTDPDWELDASKTELYRNDDRGHAYNLLFKYKDVPVFYTPFLSFPLSKKRHTGFLYPTIGSSGESGSVVSTPYYFNLAENYDLTLTPTNFSGRGQMFELEMRHRSKFSNTEIELANLASDNVKRKSRHAFFIRDNRSLLDTLEFTNNAYTGTLMHTNINVGGVSDKTYFDDFGNTVSRVGRSHILRRAEFIRADYGDFGTMNTRVMTEGYQIAKDGLYEQYKRVPQIKFSYNSPKESDNLSYNFDGEIVRFDHTLTTKPTGTRYTLYPSIEYPIRKAGWEILPKLGVKHTSYSLSNNPITSITRSTSILSLYGKMVFEKRTGESLFQTLEPQMYFLHIPAGNQDDIPIFDSGETDFKYTLFAENRFYGEDRLNDAKQLTLALTSRLMDTSTGNELLTGTIGQILYLDDRSVHLTSSTTKHSDASNLVGVVNAKLADYWRLSGYTEFNPHAGYGDKNQIRLSFVQPYGRQQKIFNTSYRFSRGSQEEIDLSGVFPVNNRLSLIGKMNYSFNNGRSNKEETLEKMFGFEYESCCYGIKFVVRDYWNGTKTDNAFYFEFLPKGLSTSTNKTAEVLRQGILGYQDSFDY